MPTPAPVTHWFDFVCPFCYLAQQRNGILRAAGVDLTELPYPIHPEIPPGGQPAPLRRGPMYDTLRREADAAGLPLTWSDRLVYSRPALVLSEIVRQTAPARHARFCREVFDAYFGRGRDVERPDVLSACLTAAEVQMAWPPSEPVQTIGETGLQACMQQAQHVGITGTPAWLIDGELLIGLQTPAVFEGLARRLGRA